MANVMEQGSGEDRAPLMLRYVQCQGHSVRDLVGAERVLHAGVVGAGKHKVGESKLVHAVQALHLRPLQQVQVYTAQLYAAVDAVMDHLVVWHRRKIKIGLYIDFEKPSSGQAPGPLGIPRHMILQTIL